MVTFDLGDAGSLPGFHGSPRSATDLITIDTSLEELTEMLAGHTHELLAGGHTHVPLVQKFGTQTLINPGSIGLPFARYGFVGDVRVLRHASYATITLTGGTVDIGLHQIEYDRSALESRVRDSGMPNGEWWLSLAT